MPFKEDLRWPRIVHKFINHLLLKNVNGPWVSLHSMKLKCFYSKRVLMTNNYVKQWKYKQPSLNYWIFSGPDSWGPTESNFLFQIFPEIWFIWSPKRLINHGFRVPCDYLVTNGFVIKRSNCFPSHIRILSDLNPDKPHLL